MFKEVGKAIRLKNMNLKEKIYLIGAIGTDIGKTFLAENLCRILREKNMAVSVIKPIASGFEDGDLNSDSAKILAALGLEISVNSLDSITPWRFKEATSPHFAAKNSDQKIDFLAVKKFCQQKISLAKKRKEFLFIETAGGMMTPINEEKNFLDLAEELKIPILLLSANYLGSISHTLCAVKALTSQRVCIEKILINDYQIQFEKPSAANISQVVLTVQNFSGIETISLPNFLTNFSLGIF